jgi:hypothetical protein
MIARFDCEKKRSVIQMYNSHPIDGTYGNPGFFVADPSGKIRDSSGRMVELRPDESERYARRILVRTSEIKNTDGVYSAKIRRAKNVSAIKLSYASIPRPMSRVTAQLILYSIAIKKSFDSEAYQTTALQRLCRSQLLSPDTSDAPFFRISRNDFDWRNDNATGAWINSFDRNTFIPPQLESEVSNQYIDIDVLTVKVPSGCNLNSLGSAFSNALKSHSGYENIRNNSLWTSFDISVEETGFSVLENINDADVFTTFASIAPPNVTSIQMQSLSVGGILSSVTLQRQNQSAVDSFVPMGTPLTIKMKKSTSVYVSSDSLTGASTSPAYISPSFSKMEEILPTSSVDANNISVFTTTIPNINKLIYSFSCFGNVSADDILEVSFKPVVEMHVTALPSTAGSTTFNVNFFYGSRFDGEKDIILRNGSDDAIAPLTFKATASSDGTSITIAGGATFNRTTSTLSTSSPSQSQKVHVGSAFFFIDSTPTSITTMPVAEVKRTYQKTRDIRLSLKWGDNKEGENFFIDTNQNLDSPIISNDPIIRQINPNFDFTDEHRRDVALLSQYSKGVTGTVGTSFSGNSLPVSNLTMSPPNASFVPGMIVTGNMTKTDASADVTVSSVGLSLDLSQTINVSANTALRFQVKPQNNNTYHNLLRNTGDLEDTYIEPSTTSSEVFNVHEVNDAHQSQRMLFSGHMMNVAEPTPMPTTSDSFPQSSTGLRPTLNIAGSIPSQTSDFYQHGLGWQTSIVHAPTRFVMPAFPVRFTELANPASSSNAPSIYSTTSIQVESSVSPLVSRILNPTAVSGSTVGYYKFNKIREDLTPDTFIEANASSSSSTKVNGLSYYTPRSDNKCGIVVTIGNENYVVKRAHLISVLRNETDYTLNLTCDRHYNSSPVVLSSIRNLERLRDHIRSKGYNTDKERADRQAELQNVETELQNAFHTFYSETETGTYQVDPNAKYFAWAYELDRPVLLPNGISSTKVHSDVPTNPAVSMRTFNGIADNASLFTPGIYERITGRPAVTSVQESAHSFFVRSGVHESDNSLLVLHGIGSLERPLNSTRTRDAGDLFAVMGTETDQKKTDKMVCDSTAYMRSPDNLEALNFHFISSKTGEKLDIGNQNATLVFDIYCANE